MLLYVVCTSLNCGILYYREFEDINKANNFKDALKVFGSFFGGYYNVKIRRSLYSQSDGFYGTRISNNEIFHIKSELLYLSREMV